jgi:multidrug efflux pump
VISRFFIDRPVFASVLSIVLVIAGALSAVSLPVSQYPPIVPPTVQVAVTYPGASAQVVADTVAAPIEQQVNGVDNMLYMCSTSDNTGAYNLIVTFALGTELNDALVAVQNRVNLAVPQLPNAVQKQGLTIKKKSPNILMSINFISPDGRYDDIFMSNYATIHAKDEIFRIEGIGDITYLGQRDYSIRAWLDPQQMASRGITANEVIDAIRYQNAPLAVGMIGQQPSGPGLIFQQPLDGKGRLATPEEFGEIIVRSISNAPNSASAQMVRLRDVARVEMGAAKYDQYASNKGLPSVALAIYQLPGSNALDVGERVRNKMKELKKKFPPGLDYRIDYDTTPFIQESVTDVISTLRDAIILVGIVVLAFLQSWRATLIPLIAVPVAIIGTFAVMAALGFSINNISLFGLVLAIGIVVDDAIVVVENVERWLAEGMSPPEAARKAMDEVTGPVVAVALVLCAVFIPCAFISGITGQFFRQFAVTIAISTVFSAFNSLTLSPALAAILLRPHGAGPDPFQWLINITMGWFFWIFEKSFTAATNVYVWIVKWLLFLRWPVLVGYIGLLFVTVKLFQMVPTGFIPAQDQGYVLINLQMPESASVQRTREIMAALEKISLETPGVKSTSAIAGFTVLLSMSGPNYGSIFVILDEFDQRREPHLKGNAIMLALRQRFHDEIKEGVVSVFGAPPVPGLGPAGGFKAMIEDRSDLGATELDTHTTNLLVEGRKNSGFFGLFTMYSARAPQLFADIDRAKARSMGIKIEDVNNALQTFIGTVYVNNFNAFGRFWQVNVMADQQFRRQVENLNLVKVRNSRGDMVPLGSVIDVRDTTGPGMVMRYNLYRAAPVNGVALPWIMSSTEAMDVLDEVALGHLPRSMRMEWTELNLLQRLEAADWRNAIVFPLAVVFVFLVLAALYESWTLPLAVILVVPMCLLSAVIGVAIARMDINIFTQIGFVVLVGLASKNAILIVEFAKQLRDEGKSVREATVEACRMRLRPILMTSFAFIFGVVPLVIATGAGAEMRRALGTAVFSGMLGVTIFGILLTPVFFMLIAGFSSSSGNSDKLFPVRKRSIWYAIVTFGLSAVLQGNRKGLFRTGKPLQRPEGQA